MKTICYAVKRKIPLGFNPLQKAGYHTKGIDSVDL